MDRKITNMRSKRENIPVKCNVCQKVFTRKDSLKTHMFIHRKDAASGYICDLCGKAYAKLYRLKTHMLTHYGDGENKQNISRKTDKVCI